MTEIIKVRQLVEFEVHLDDRNGWDIDDFNRRLALGEIDLLQDAEGDVVPLTTEIVSRAHEINYVFDCGIEEELYYLVADGERVFSHRDHNEIAREWGRRTGNEVTFSHDFSRRDSTFLDYGDPDKSWDIIKGRA